MACDMCTSFMSFFLYAYWSCLCRRQTGFTCCRKRCSPLRIVHQKLPDLMSAGTIIIVAAFAGIEIVRVIAANPAIDEPVLEVRHGVAFLAAVDRCGGNVINACRPVSSIRRKREQGQLDAGR